MNGGHGLKPLENWWFWDWGIFVRTVYTAKVCLLLDKPGGVFWCRKSSACMGKSIVEPWMFVFLSFQTTSCTWMVSKDWLNLRMCLSGKEIWSSKKVLGKRGYRTACNLYRKIWNMWCRICARCIGNTQLAIQHRSYRTLVGLLCGKGEWRVLLCTCCSHTPAMQQDLRLWSSQLSTGASMRCMAESSLEWERWFGMAVWCWCTRGWIWIMV